MKINVCITSVLRRYCVGARRALRLGCVGVLVLGVAACNQTPPPDSAVTGYRDPSAILAATTRFDPAKFSGDWNVVQALPMSDARVRFRFDLSDGSGRADEILAFGPVSAPVATATSSYTITQTVPGVLNVMSQSNAAQTWVVMWVDESYSTAAFGWANGRRAYILARPGKARADQISAAREVLDFNGWDVSQLRKSK